MGKRRYRFVDPRPEINNVYEMNMAMSVLQGSLASLESRVKHNTISPEDKKQYLEELRTLMKYLESIAPKFYKKNKKSTKHTKK